MKKRRPIRALLALFVLTLVGVMALVVGNVTGRGASYVPSLALDLEGGTQLILTPVSIEEGAREVTEDDIAEAINIIRSRVDASGVAEAEITSLGSENIVVSIPGTPSQETLDLIRSSSQMNFRPVLRIAAATTTATTSESATVEAAQSGQAAQSGDAVQSGAAVESAQSADAAQSADSAQSVVVPTMVPNAMSAEEAMLAADTNGDGVLSDVPASEPANNSDLVWETEQAMFDLYTLDCSTAVGRVEGPSDKPYAACDDTGSLKYLLGPVDVPGSNLDSASAGMITNQQGQPTGEWGVNLQFDSEGTTLFSEASERLYGYKTDSEGAQFFNTPDRNHFGAVLDGKVISAPSMNGIITNGNPQISGNFTATSAVALANQLNFGSLPLNFEVQSEQQISATLGSEHLEKGIWAGLIGLLLVVIYMICQYRALALLSAGSLVVAGGLTYLVITLLSWTMGYRLSLAGIAGLIVAVGVTADSFIVYFERIRDEVRDGRPLSAAVSEGWERARRTIVISDAVNLVAAVVLYVLAVGGVQGFAFTLGVTTVVDLLVIFGFTHPLMELLIRTNFFGGGHKLSGLDPEHLGARSALTYAGRGRFTDARASGKGASALSITGSDEGEVRLSLARRKRAEREAAAAAEAAAETTSAETTSDAITVADKEGEER